MATANDVIRLAASHIGINGTDNIFNTWIWGRHVYDPNTYPWCAAFVSYVLFKEAGVAGTPSASASGVATQFQRVSDENAQPGDLVVFNWDGRSDLGWCDHVGFVEWSDITGGGYFGTIEGNTGYSAEGEVARVTRYNYGGYFTAFFRPVYDGSNVPDAGSGGSTGGGNYQPSVPNPGAGTGGGSGAQWQGELRGKVDTTGSGDDYAGVVGRPMLYVAVGGVGQYQASDMSHGWWPRVSKYDINDDDNGRAGNGDPIDRFRIFDDSVFYQTHNLGGVWNGVMRGTKDISGESYDDFAGETGVQQDLIRIWRENGEQPVYNVFS